MIQTVVFDTKPYDRQPLQRASAESQIEWRFMDCRLSAETAAAAHGAQAVCTFVNDRARSRHARPCPGGALQMHDQSNWLIEWIFRSPTHDKFLKVVVEILFVKRRRVDCVEELFEVPEAYLDSILASSSC